MPDEVRERYELLHHWRKTRAKSRGVESDVRITSYNVCYTKLLRGHALGTRRADGRRGLAPANGGQQVGAMPPHLIGRHAMQVL